MYLCRNSGKVSFKVEKKKKDISLDERKLDPNNK